DANNQRVFNLHMAELEWDRGDDPNFIHHAMLALEPDVEKAGPMAFALDEQSPRIILHHLIETSLRTGNIAQASALAAQARTNHFLNRDANSYPPLELACRKV